MSNNIIEEIKKIDADINLQYRKSKLPVFIKNIITSKKRNKLKKVISKIEKQNIIPVKLLFDYIKTLYYTYPPYGRYNSCIRVSPVTTEENGLFVAIFDIILDNGILNVSIMTSNKENTLCSIAYNYNIDSNSIFSFTDEDKEFLETSISDINIDFTSKDNYQKARDVFCTVVIRDITKYLYDMIKRSERINI